MKKTIIIAVALMFLATPVFARHRPPHPTPTPTPTPVVEEPAVGLLPSPLPSTTRYFENGQVVREEVVDRDGVVLSSFVYPTPTPTPEPIPVFVRTWLDDIQDMLNGIQAKINELIKLM
jgi:hypothetical protein